MNTKTKYIISAALFALFIVLIILVKTVDVAPAGPLGTEIGLSGINSAAARALPYRNAWYKITVIIGLAAIAAAAAFALLGLAQLIKRKSLLRVDRAILALGGLYVAVIIIYVLFEKVIVNYRPILLPAETEPAASFPSSHTMLVCVVAGSAAMLLGRYIKSRRLCTSLRVLCAAAAVITVAGRLVSGVHWLTDITGGCIISAALLMLYSAVLDRA